MAYSNVIGDKKAKEIATFLIKDAEKDKVDLPALKKFSEKGLEHDNVYPCLEELNNKVNVQGGVRLNYDDSNRLRNYFDQFVPTKFQIEVWQSKKKFADGGKLDLAGFDSWRNGPAYNNTIRLMNDKDVDYTSWSDVDIYKWSLENNEDDDDEFAEGGTVSDLSGASKYFVESFIARKIARKDFDKSNPKYKDQVAGIQEAMEKGYLFVQEGETGMIVRPTQKLTKLYKFAEGGKVNIHEKYGMDNIFSKVANKYPVEKTSIEGLKKSMSAIGPGQVTSRDDDGDRLMYKEMLNNDKLIFVVHGDYSKSPFDGTKKGYWYDIAVYQNNPRTKQIGGGYGASPIMSTHHTVLFRYDTGQKIYLNENIIGEVAGIVRSTYTDNYAAGGTFDAWKGGPIEGGGDVTQPVYSKGGKISKDNLVTNGHGDFYILDKKQSGHFVVSKLVNGKPKDHFNIPRNFDTQKLYRHCTDEEFQEYIQNLNDEDMSDKKFASGGSVDTDARIYVADLAAYNEGKLIGEWLDLSDYSSGSEVMDAIQELLDKWSKEQGEKREEYAIHDHENLPSDFYSEYMGEAEFDKFYEVAQAASDAGIPLPVVMQWMSDHGIDDPSSAADAYQGEYDDMEDFAYRMVQEGVISDLSSYIYMTDTDRRIFAGEEADNRVEDMDDEDELIEHANMEDDLEELEKKRDRREELESEIETVEGEISDLKEDEDANKDEIEEKETLLSDLESEFSTLDDFDFDEKKTELAESAKDTYRDELYREIYDKLSDPVDYFVEEQGIYSMDDLRKAGENPPFGSIDYEKLGRELGYDYNEVEHDGKTYIFNSNYKRGGKIAAKKYAAGDVIKSNLTEMKEWELNSRLKTFQAEKAAGNFDDRSEQALVLLMAEINTRQGNTLKDTLHKRLKKDGTFIKVHCKALGGFPERDLWLKYDQPNFVFKIYATRDGKSVGSIGEKNVLDNIDNGIYAIVDVAESGAALGKPIGSTGLFRKGGKTYLEKVANVMSSENEGKAKRIIKKHTPFAKGGKTGAALLIKGVGWLDPSYPKIVSALLKKGYIKEDAKYFYFGSGGGFEHFMIERPDKHYIIFNNQNELAIGLSAKPYDDEQKAYDDFWEDSEAFDKFIMIDIPPDYKKQRPVNDVINDVINNKWEKLFEEGGSAGDMQTWKFTYTNLPNVKKALDKNKHPLPGVTKQITTDGKDYSEAFMKARNEAKFKESQLIGSRQLTESEKKNLKFAKGGKTKLPEKGTPDWHQLQIAKKTMGYSDIGAQMMGGQTKEEARKILDKYGVKYAKGGDLRGDKKENNDFLPDEYYHSFTQKGNGRRQYSIFGSIDRRQAAKQLFPDMTYEEHKKRAKEYKEKRDKALKEYSDMVDTEFEKQFGRKYHLSDYKVSGIVRDEFSSEVKDKIRNKLKEEGSYSAAYHLHNAMLKKADKFSAGGKPIGSTGLFAKGGKFSDLRVEQHGRYLTLAIQGNKLHIFLTEEGKEKAEEEGGVTYQNFDDFFDDIRGNSELLYFPDLGEANLEMTSAPAITDGYYHDDDGEIKWHKDAKMWFYPDYAVKDPFEELTKEGEVDFDDADNYQAGGKPIGSTGLFESGGTAEEWLGGKGKTNWEGAVSGKAGLDAMKEYSKKHPKDVFILTDDNYSHIGKFWLKNGQIARLETLGNHHYDFAHKKTTLRAKDDVIYKIRKTKNR